MMADNTHGKDNDFAAALPAPGLDLAATLYCGQSFVWRRLETGWHSGAAAGRAVMVKMTGDTLLLASPKDGAEEAPDLEFWRHYFALDEDYEGMLARFAQDEALAACVAAAPGLRVLRQPLWDILLSFILSQNNNIARITGIVDRLRNQYGPHLAGGEYAFPAPEVLAGLTAEDLAPLGAGYRAGYLVDAARAVAGRRVTEKNLQALPDDEARTLLCTIKGVGPKVADCVLLYGLGRADVVPMDVWMKRAVAALYPDGMPVCAEGSRGIAQQYIFIWARENLPRG